MICFHILKVKAETGATERRREAVTKTSEEDHDREKVKNRKNASLVVPVSLCITLSLGR